MQQNKIPSNEALMNYWVNKARGILTSINANKTAIYWSNEDTYYLQVKPTDYLEFWGFTSNLTQLATLYPNNKIIISPGDRFYLDCGMGNKYGGNSWCDPYHTWYSIYTLEPTQYLSASQVLGGEVVMFGELVNDFVIDGKIWPRAAAMADRFWNENVALNVTAVIGRLQALYDTMTYHGIGASPITGHYCEKNLNFCFSSPN